MGSVGDIGEFGLIGRLAKLVPSAPDVVEGIGDDCAVLRIADETLLVSCDQFIEDVHFRRATAGPFDIGWKATAASLSDIAAMGGAPRYCLVSLACPRETEVGFVETVYRGMAEILSKHNTVIVGGDTTRSANCVVLDVTALGQPSGGRPLCRKGAQPGDVLVITGYPGMSAGGLDALEHGRDAPELVRAHLRPEPRVAEGQWLCRQDAVHAMIDVSDGVVQDAGHVADSSGLGVDVAPEKLPISPALEQYAAQLGVTPARTPRLSQNPIHDLALTGGEDYELAAAVDGQLAAETCAAFHEEFDLPLTVIGAFTEAWHGVRVAGQPVDHGGFDHFK